LVGHAGAAAALELVELVGAAEMHGVAAFAARRALVSGLFARRGGGGALAVRAQVAAAVTGARTRVARGATARRAGSIDAERTCRAALAAAGTGGARCATRLDGSAGSVRAGTGAARPGAAAHAVGHAGGDGFARRPRARQAGAALGGGAALALLSARWPRR